MQGARLDWNPKAFKKALLNNLLSEMEIVGAFVESDARRRLHDIADPAWGRAYREQVVSRLLTNIVKVGKNEVIATVGVKKSPSGSHHGFYIEMGSSTAPAHPFLRPAVFQNGPQIIALLEGR